MYEITEGGVFRFKYPFVRAEYEALDEDGPHIRPTWNPGIRWEDYGPEDCCAFADGEGEAVLTVVSIHRPGRFPTRVFYTRKFISPDGDEFGKGGLRIATLEKFRRLARGYRFHYEIEVPA